MTSSQINLRIPSHVAADWRDRAAGDRRGLTAWVVARVTEALAGAGDRVEPPADGDLFRRVERLEAVTGKSLASIPLPEAIAATVEAWYDAQDVEGEPTQADPPWCADLDECIDYIGHTVIHWKDAKQRKKTTTIYELLDIRSRERLGCHSNAERALRSAGIHYRGKGGSDIRITPDSLPIFDYDHEAEERWTNAILSYPCEVFQAWGQPWVAMDASLFFECIEGKLPRAAEVQP
jgi:hypothetical protein